MMHRIAAVFVALTLCAFCLRAAPYACAQEASADDFEVRPLDTSVQDEDMDAGGPGGSEEEAGEEGAEDEPEEQVREEPEPEEEEPAEASTYEKPEPPQPPPPVIEPAKRPAPPAVKSTDKERAERELKFYKETLRAADPAVLPALLVQIDSYIHRYRDQPGADQAQYLKLQIHERQGALEAAAVDALKMLYEYPDTRLNFSAKKTLMEAADKKMKKLKPRLIEIAKGPKKDLDRPERLASLLAALADLDDKGLYRPVVEELGDFLKRFPNHPRADEMTYLMARVYSGNGEYESAVMLNRKIIAVYPGEELAARAQAAIGDIYAERLKDYDKAVTAYQTVTEKYAGSPPAGEAYVKMARILDKNLKQPALAVEVLEKIVKNYPETDSAHQAFLESARILEDRLDQPTGAIEHLEGLAAMFPGDRAVSALDKAADIAGGMKDYPRQAKLLEKRAGDFPQAKGSNKALWEAGQIFEKRLEDSASAAQVYRKIVEKYAGTRTAKKASKRLKALGQ